ncbi:MAG TPA: hypothetical protein VE175_00410, partial [Woeseiaceae bacterium]|nr:hypothetical protein [Woeseiaceae bacterium]
MIEYVAPLAQRIRDLHRELGRPVIVGINGAQGSGKSTLALFLSNWLERETGLATARLSIDDMYLGKSEREALSRTLHPLFATRGVPGTHDIGLGERVLDALTASGSPRSVHLPAFDKASDDRLPETRWPRVEAPVDAVLFEGWCVGARPQEPAQLAEPINALEEEGLYRDLGLQAILYQPDTTAWMQRIRPILEKKQRLGADAWGSLETGIQDVMDPIYEMLAREFPDYDPYPNGADREARRLIRHILISEAPL